MIAGILLMLPWLLASVTSTSRDGGWALRVDGKQIAHFETKAACMAEAKRNIEKYPAVPGHKPESSDSSWSVLAPLLVGGASVVRYDCVGGPEEPVMNEHWECAS